MIDSLRWLIYLLTYLFWYRTRVA